MRAQYRARGMGGNIPCLVAGTSSDVQRGARPVMSVERPAGCCGGSIQCGRPTGAKGFAAPHFAKPRMSRSV